MKIKRASKRTLARQLTHLRRQYLDARKRNQGVKAYTLRLYIAKHAELMKAPANG